MASRHGEGRDDASPATPTAQAHGADPHDFDPEPAHALSAGEQPSPRWLPVLGAFVVAGGLAYWLWSGDGASTTAPTGAASAAASARGAAARPAEPPPANAPERLRSGPPVRPSLPPAASPPTPAPPAATSAAATPR
ncbi:MAG: hypothetical protein IT373_00470 [Polyangiaceae bacterium]|nr:hypothetical protein [Polyangiaceae bacterium]